MNFIRQHSPGLTAVFLLLLLFGLSSLFYPFGRDQGIHAQVGAAWLDGQLPYRDVWHTKGFLSFVPHLLATAVFGHQMWGIRLLELFWQFGSGLLIFSIGKRRMNQWGALLAVGLYYLVYYAFGYWHLAQPEGFLTPVVLLAVWLYDKGSVSDAGTRYFFLSGVLVSLAPWFKQTAVVFVVGLIAWAIYDYWSSRERRQRAGLVLGGALLTNGVLVGITAVTGMFNPMLEAFSFVFFDYPNFGQVGLVDILQLTSSWAIWFPAPIFPFLAGMGLILSDRALRPQWMGILLMALIGLAGVYIQWQLWLYHWVSTLPFMVLIGVFAIESSLSTVLTLPNKKQKGIVWLFAFMCIAFALPVLNRHVANGLDVASFLIDRTSETAYLENYDLADVVETAEYLAAHTEETEPVFVWGHYAMIYYLAERPNPTRFINDPPLSLPHDRLETFRQEAVDDLTTNPPAYIVVATDDATSLESQTSKEQLPDFTALAEFMAANYRLEIIIGDFELYAWVLISANSGPNIWTNFPGRALMSSSPFVILASGRYFCLNSRNDFRIEVVSTSIFTLSNNCIKLFVRYLLQ